ncbi:energy transducer TonB [Psychrobacter sp. DAB_AL43B]|uniref:energy transducer TonB n=1 Tax=Psychrobacter sp. DAB_AL43B TaxID=1028416 RepID=UPI0015532C10|nr:energy transducer TonB [Psychrobacter sp. DAB_AL43B]
MISKLLSNPACNTVPNNIDYNSTTNIKTICTYSLLASILILLTLTVSITPAQAELVDLSNSESVIQFSSRDANWLQPPKFSFNRRSLRCLDEETGEPVKISREQKFEVTLGLQVDKQGKITKTYVKKSSGNKCFDRSAARQVQTGRLMPFLLKGKAVRGRVSLPIAFEY